MSMLSVPEGTWSGASGVPAPHLMRAERGSFPASRSALRDLNVKQLTRRKNLAHTKTALFGKCVRRGDRPDGDNIQDGSEDGDIRRSTTGLI